MLCGQQASEVKEMYALCGGQVSEAKEIHVPCCGRVAGEKAMLGLRTGQAAEKKISVRQMGQGARKEEC